MVRVSDLIKLEEIKNWCDEEIVSISAGTGVGKSYFIKNILYKYAKENNFKILFIVHRANCKDQFQMELEKDNKTDIIDITTYQNIENKIIKNKIIELEQYTYIVCDEMHYWMDDSTFNKASDISLETILSLKCTRIFMSATDSLIKNYLKNKKNIHITEYNIPLSFDFIKSLSFFNKANTMNELAKECIDKDEKGIFFIQSVKKAYELYLEFKDYAIFNCSKSNKEYYKHVDVELINNMLLDEKFDKNMLITTTCFDAGLNLVDKEIGHVVCDIKDTNTLVQCLGRKRLVDDNDKIHVYIKSISNQQLGGIRTQIQNKLLKSEYLRNNGTEMYVKKYYKNTNDYSNIVYDDIVDGSLVKKVNELIYYKNKHTILEIDLMLSNGDFGYNKFYSKMFNIERYRVLEEEDFKNDLVYYLDGIVGKRLFKDEQKELIDKVDLKRGGKQLKSYESINCSFKECKLPYLIIPKVVKHNKSTKRCWILEKIVLID